MSIKMGRVPTGVRNSRTNGRDTYRKSLRQRLFAFPLHFTGHLEEFHVALGEVRSIVGEKHEHAPARRDDALTSREQRAMLFFSSRKKRTYVRTHPHIHAYVFFLRRNVDGNDGDAPGND